MSTNDSLETTPRLPVHAEQKAARTGSTHAPHSTPGPWAWDGDGTRKAMWLLDAHNDAVISGDVKVHELGDAQLIAAAPDLYKALKAITEALHQAYEANPEAYLEFMEDISPDDFVELRRNAAVAIAKAEGRS